MNIITLESKLPCLIIKNTFLPEQVKAIYKELDFLHPHLLTPDQTSSAFHNGEYLKKNKGIFTGDFYTNVNFSNIDRVRDSLFSNLEFQKTITDLSPPHSLIFNSNVFHTLISYFDDGDYYKPHKDSAAISFVTYFFREPKNFTGGKIIFPDFNVEIEPENNLSVVFLSSMLHEVTPITILDKSKVNTGRYSITTLCQHR